MADADESGTADAVGDKVADFDGLGVVADDEGGSSAGGEAGADAGIAAFVLKGTWLTPKTLWPR